MKALNALVMFLGKTYAAIDESALPIIRRLSCVSFDESLSMDEATLDALGIFKLVQHPIVCSNGRAKEGSSLFGLVDRTRTGPGRCLLRRWLARPSQSLRVIGERQDAVEFLTEPSRVAFLSDARAALKAVVGLKHVAAAFLQHKANGNDWRSLINGMSASFDLGEAYEKAFGSENAASEMGEVGTVRRVGCALLDAGIAELSSQLSAIIDMEETERRGLGGTTLPAVKEGVDETLDSLRATYAGLGDVLDLLAGVELEALTAPWVTSLNAVYLPQVGFLVAIPVPHTEHGISSSGDDNDDNWMEGIDFEFLFKTHRAAYFKSPGCKEMDTRLGDVHGNMVDAEREVLRRLACVICAAAPGLVELADACIELDAVSSLALTAAENGWTRPVLTAEGKTFTIRGARNPLLEMCAPDKTCVRNTVDLSVVGVGGAVGDVGVGGGGGKVWFLTGPNSSGKSVYLSEIGLVIVLAQCGSFVPAEEAVLPVLDVVCCRGRPKESAVGKLSSFACECAQLAAALPTLTERSLLLLDEFGKGTDVDDGTALLGAAVAHLALLPEGKRPRAVVATHYLDALTLVEKRLGEELFKERVVPLCMEYFVGSNENSEFGDGSDDVVFLYRVKEGVSGVSLVMQCARAVGLPAQVVDRAEQVAKAITDGVEIQKLMDDQDVVNEQKMRRVLQSFASLDTSSVDNVSEFISLVKSL